AGLRAAFGPETTSEGRGGVLARLGVGGGGVRLLPRDEPGEAVGVLAMPGDGGGIGRYEVAGAIARGGVGVVLRGRGPGLGREVALKVLRPEHAGTPSLVRRLIEEAQIGGQLQHPGILPVYELGLDAEGRPFFSMKVVRGRSLAERLRERPDPAHDRPR